MFLLDNPFYKLNIGADSKKNVIREALEDYELEYDVSDSKKIGECLLKPLNRIEAEVSWLWGLTNSQITGILDVLATSSSYSKTIETIRNHYPEAIQSNINNVNITTEALKMLKTTDTIETYLIAINSIGESIDLINVDSLIEEINSARSKSGIPLINDAFLVEKAIDGKKTEIVKLINSKLNRLSSEKKINLVTTMIENGTEHGECVPASIPASIVELYELESKENLLLTVSELENILENIRTELSDNASDDILVKDVNKLINKTEEWDKIAQPIQVYKRSKGMEDEDSTKVAHMLRNLSIELHNVHNKTSLSLSIVNAMKKIFAESFEISDIVTNDEATLQKFQKDSAEEEKFQKFYEYHIKPLSNTAKIHIDGGNGNKGAELIINSFPSVSNKMADEGLSVSSRQKVKELLASIVYSCAISYGNKTNNWGKCIDYLTFANQLVIDPVLREKIRTNLETARANDKAARNKDHNSKKIEPITSAPFLFRSLFFSFAMFGRSDEESDILGFEKYYTATYCLWVFIIPLIPIGRYRIAETPLDVIDEKYRFIGKCPFRPIDWLHLMVGLFITAYCSMLYLS